MGDAGNSTVAVYYPEFQTSLRRSLYYALHLLHVILCRDYYYIAHTVKYIPCLARQRGTSFVSQMHEAI